MRTNFIPTVGSRKYLSEADEHLADPESGTGFTRPRESVRDPSTAFASSFAADAPQDGSLARRLTVLRMTAGVFASVAAVMGALAVWSNFADAAITQRDQQALAKADLVYVATVRKNGTQSKAAPVWFTSGLDNDSILIQTGPTTWKAKRIRRGSPVLVWIGKADGPALIGKAEITNDPAIRDKILKDFREKYWQNRVMGIGPSRAVFDSGERIAIKITPVRDLQDGFTSQPGSAPPPMEGAGK
jgi:general stress protein 26